jgi:60 kDa SS-A/Ro ribonucleoprotein
MRFRTTKPHSKTENLAGGEAYKQDAKMELVSLLLTSFVNDKFYEKADDQLARLTKLAEGIKDKKFLGQAAIFARTEYGMRSITHALLGEMVHLVKGEEWTKRAIAKAIHRPDDILETFAYYAGKYGKPIPNSLKKGAALALEQFDGYQMAKYRGERSDIKMVDVFNLIHPKPAHGINGTYKALMEGTLKTTGKTWEANLTAAGQKAETEEDKAEMKKDVWATMLKENKLGYFALLKNLRNIEEQAPEALSEALRQLRDEKAIKKSLVMPFRFSTAIEQVKERKTIEALNDAFEISLNNVPNFDGKTLIVLDVSGSMNGKPMEIGSLFAAVLYKANPDADFMQFSESATYLKLNSKDTAITLARRMAEGSGGGTNFHAIFDGIENKVYKRIIILSDMQGWMGYNVPTSDLAQYEKLTGAKPFVYSFDLAGMGTLQFPQDRVFAIAGFSEKVFDLFSALEQDKNALVHKIEAIEV